MDVGVLSFVVLVENKKIGNPLMAFVWIPLQVGLLEDPRDICDVALAYPFTGRRPKDVWNPLISWVRKRVEVEVSLQLFRYMNKEI